MATSGTCSSSGSGQFKATRIWNTLVHHMQENVNVKRRKNSKRYYDECFAGCHAVDSLHSFVQCNPELFSNSATIARENIVRLCQSFLDMGVIEGATNGGDDAKVVTFDDSPTSLYYFKERSNKEDTDPTLLGGRTVLREIDGELRNSLGHISISSDERAKLKNSSTLQRTKNLLIPLRNKSENRSRFPSFGKLKGQSLKQTFRNSVIHSKGEDDGPDTRGSRKLKRTSSFAGMTIRSSSDTNLHKSSSASSSSEFESADEKEKKSGHAGNFVYRRFSQRLSFRKKSLSSNNEPVQLLAADRLNPGTLGDPPLDMKIHDESPSSFRRFDATRKSVPMKTGSSKPRRSLRRMVSSPFLVNKMMQRTRVYDVNKDAKFASPTNQPAPHCLSPRKVMPASNRVERSRDGESSFKISRKEPIKETPSRRRPPRVLPAYSSLAHRVSVTRRSLRKSETKDSSACHNTTSRRERKLSPQELSHIQRECIRVRLLQILDIPFVEDLITSPTSGKKTQGASSMTSSSRHVNYSEVVTSYYSSDPWITSSLSVLHHIPDGYDILRRHVRESPHMKKIKLYFAISDHYKSLSRPLVDSGFLGIISVLVQTLETKPASKSLQALQLFLHLLPGDVLLQLRHLIDFLNQVISSDDVTLAPKMTNSMLVLRTFSTIVFPNTEKKCDVTSGLHALLRLTIEQRHQAFVLPQCVSTAVDRKRHLVETGKVESPSMIPNSFFSQPMSGEDYSDEAAEETQRGLSDLARFIISDDNLSQRKKKDFLKKLQSSHPSVCSTLGPLKPSHTPPPTAPSSDTLSRRRNKPRKQVYV